MDRAEFCKKLRLARVHANLKQETVAKRLKVPTSAVSAIEAGTRKVDVLELELMAKLYSKRIQWFFEPDEGTLDFRGYPEDALLSEAYNMAKQAPPKLQKAISCAIMGFLKES